MKLSYNSHYVIASEMFYYPEVHTIFEYLMDLLVDLEYQAAHDKKAKRWLEDNPSTIKISISEILNKFAIGKQRASQVFKIFEDVGLIECVRAKNGRIQSCTICRPRFYSFIQFYKQLNEDERIKFSENLYKEDGLSKYSIPELSKSEIHAQQSKPTPKLPLQVDLQSETTPNGSLTTQNDSKRKSDDMKRLEMAVSELIDTAVLVRFIQENYQSESFEDEIYSISPEFWAFHADETSTKEFIEDPEAFLKRFPTFQTAIWGRFVALKLPFRVVSAPIYINNNKRKFGKERSDAQVKIELGVKGEEEENSQLDLTKVEVLNLIEQEEPIFRQSSVTPYFNSQEVDDIVSDIDKAKQNPFWLFLYNFWGYASDYTPEDEDIENIEDNEEGNGCEQSSVFNDPEGKPLSLLDFETCKREAYKRTLSEIKNKKLEDFDDEIDFNPEDLFSEKLMSKIFDWEQVGFSRQEHCVIVSKDRIRNIEATKLTSVTHPQNREERRAAMKEGREVMAKLYKAKSSQKLYSQLTRIEKMVADFISCYFQPNPDKEDSSPFIFSGSDILPKDEWRKVKVMLNKYHLSVDDFLEACIEKDGPSEERLPLKRVMFFADGIKFINTKYQETSILDTIEV